METMTETGTEKRLDDLARSTDRGFDRVDAGVGDLRAEIQGLRSEMNSRFSTVDTKLEAVDARFDSLQRLMIVFFSTTLGSIIAGVVVMVLTHS
jgi:hypothetical protein